MRPLALLAVAVTIHPAAAQPAAVEYAQPILPAATLAAGKHLDQVGRNGWRLVALAPTGYADRLACTFARPAGSPSPLAYTVVHDAGPVLPRERLAALGKDGWLLVAVGPPVGTPAERLYVFTRPLPPPDPAAERKRLLIAAERLEGQINSMQNELPGWRQQRDYWISQNMLGLALVPQQRCLQLTNDIADATAALARVRAALQAADPK